MFVYIVRCNFTAPDQEQAWNSWYSGPKIEQMLSKPYFRSCQRFRRHAGEGRDYLALWTVESPEAFQRREYTTDWGFFEWERYITDWSRDLFDGGGAREPAFAVRPDGTLQVVAFDHMAASDAAARSAAIARSEPALMWLPIAGLDRHTPLIGLAPSSGIAPEARRYGDGVQGAIYRPISPQYRTVADSAQPQASA
jgi:hypothetical protein